MFRRKEELELGKIRWLGHSCFEIELMNKIILIDPWLDGNLKTPVKASDIKKASRGREVVALKSGEVYQF